jgi:hypothetical protein
VRYFLMACEEVDSVTTPMGRVARGARELQNKELAPILAGFLAGTGGAMIRYIERVVLQYSPAEDRTSLKALETGVWKTLGYAAIWWWLVVYRCDNHMVNADENHCSTYNGSDLLRVMIVVLHVLWSLACECGLASGHPIVWGFQTLRNSVGAPIASALQLGPAQWPAGWNGEEATARKVVKKY